MCGIFGILYKDREAAVDPAVLQSMGSVLRHRGPDAFGVWTRDNVGLGHARLSIIDLSDAGNQPMANEDGSVQVTFNGEIYNFPALKRDLLAKGHRFRSNTDTEVIVHLWEEEGVRCVERLRGMFAFAVWDDARKTLFLARDRVGKKPLYYGVLPRCIVFASEIKAILRSGEYRARPDIVGLHHYLAYQSVPSPFSAFEGIVKLPPAHAVLFEEFRGTPRRYWKLSYGDPFRLDGERSRAALEEELLETLREAVRIRLMSDVPLGAFLSGGVDSSVVTALMAGVTDRPVKTFSIGFDQDEYNELPYARTVAARYGTDHHEFVVTPDAKRIFPELVWHYGEPFADSSAIPTYYVCRLARRHVTVILTGDGGDENFAGYPRYQAGVEAEGADGSGSSLLRRIRNRRAYADFLRAASGLSGNVRRIRALSPGRLRYYCAITHFHEHYQKHLYTADMKRATRRCCSVDLMLDRVRGADAADFLSSLLALDFDLYLPDTLMTKVDIASMAHSLEARCPLLDHKFMEFAARIPSGLKLCDGESKHVFKNAVRSHLPGEVIDRPKMGFGVPIDHWFRGELREMTRDVLLSRRAVERGYFRKAYVEGMLDRHQRGENWQFLIWNLLMLELWHLMFVDGALSPPSRPTGDA